MKTITATNQSIQYLYSVVTDANVETIAKVRTSIAILEKAFEVVNAYERKKHDPITQAQVVGKQIDMIIQAGKEEAQAENLKDLRAKHKDIIENQVAPLAETLVTLDLEADQIDFIHDEMIDFLSIAKKFNTPEELNHFNNLFTALETAKETVDA